MIVVNAYGLLNPVDYLCTGGAQTFLQNQPQRHCILLLLGSSSSCEDPNVRMRILYYAVVALGRLMAGKLDALKAALPPVGVKKDLTPSQDVFWRDSLRCS